MIRRAFVVVSLLCLVSCGSSPSAPTPTPTQPAKALLKVVPGEMHFGDLTSDGWPFDAQGQNTGPGCAANVTGIVTFRAAADQPVLETANVSLPNPIIRPQETFPWGGCCLTDATARVAGVYAIQFHWTDVHC